MTPAQVAELIAAVAILGGAIWVYRRGGTQGGVLLLVLGAIIAIHALGLLEYRPSPAEVRP